jgi:hypothetical protein
METLVILVMLPFAAFAGYCMFMWLILWMRLFFTAIWAALTGKL